MLDTPYEGYEKDIMRLFKTAQNYVYDSVNPKDGLVLDSAESILTEQQVAIEFDVSKKQQCAIKYQSLQNDLKVLKSLMSECIESEEVHFTELEKIHINMPLGSNQKLRVYLEDTCNFVHKLEKITWLKELTIREDKN